VNFTSVVTGCLNWGNQLTDWLASSREALHRQKGHLRQLIADMENGHYNGLNGRWRPATDFPITCINNYSKLANFNKFVAHTFTINIMPAVQSLSHLQQELLKIYFSDIKESDLLHVKRYMSQYLAIPLMGKSDQSAEQDEDDDTMPDPWINEYEAPVTILA